VSNQVHGLTEREANQRGCPLNHWEPCRASVCVLWKWVVLSKAEYWVADDQEARDEPARPEEVPESWTWTPFDPETSDAAHWREPIDDTAARCRGVCGLSPR